jgi:hypothetical protein
MMLARPPGLTVAGAMVGARENLPRGRPGGPASGRLRQGGQDMGNAVVHFEIGGPDDQPLIAFYRQLFDWDLQPMPGGVTR